MGGGGGLGGLLPGGSPGRLVGWGGGSGWGNLGVTCPQGQGLVHHTQAPLTSPCPPSNHTITLNLTLTFAAN